MSSLLPTHRSDRNRLTNQNANGVRMVCIYCYVALIFLVTMVVCTIVPVTLVFGTDFATIFSNQAERLPGPVYLAVEAPQITVGETAPMTMTQCYCNLPGCITDGYTCNTLKGCFINIKSEALERRLKANNYETVNATYIAGCMELYLLNETVDCAEMSERVNDVKFLESVLSSSAHGEVHNFSCCSQSMCNDYTQTLAEVVDPFVAASLTLSTTDEPTNNSSLEQTVTNRSSQNPLARMHPILIVDPAHSRVNATRPQEPTYQSNILSRAASVFKLIFLGFLIYLIVVISFRTADKKLEKMEDANDRLP